jgi:hypothetical protein
LVLVQLCRESLEAFPQDRELLELRSETASLEASSLVLLERLQWLAE